MPNITFQSIDTNAKTVTVLVDGNPVTRSVPAHALSSQEDLQKYMDAYVAGLQIEFASAPQPIPQNEIPFTPGQQL